MHKHTDKNREDGRRFSAATFDAIAYVAERFMETGYPLIIEGNFVMGGYMKLNEGEVLKSLIEKYNYQSLTYIFRGDTRVICDRFNEREKTPERGQSNQVFAVLSYEDCEKWLPSFGDFTVGGRIIEVDTTDFNKIDYDGLVYEAHEFIND